MIILLVVIIAGWLGLAAAIAAQVAAVASVGWAITWGILAACAPVIAIAFDGMAQSGGCFIFVVLIVEMVAAVWAVTSLLIAASWAFIWAFLLALVLVAIWGLSWFVAGVMVN